jgi:long-subunit acyl-CoA synthetase (AMP-forming)
MSKILYALNKWAQLQPDTSAVIGVDLSLTYKELYKSVCELQEYLEQQKPMLLGMLMDNSPAWVVIDLAAQAASIPVLPIPGFFSAQQIQHTIEDTGCDFVLTDQTDRFIFLASQPPRANQRLSFLSNHNDTIWEIVSNKPKQSKIDKSIVKITYTSGTTGLPKGVCLRQSAIDSVAQSLCQTVELNNSDKHLCALPLATLLENIAGIYLPLLAGAQTVVYPLEKTGLRGSVNFDVRQFHEVLSETHANTCVLVPHLLQQLIEYKEQAHVPTSDLRFIAVGGAPIAPELLERACQCCLPVFEGYGLSESTSVVAVNSLQHHRPGSVGKPLPHVTVKIADDGEIFVKGSNHSGYLGQETDTPEYLATGDIGYLDDDGYLYLSGRKKNMFITAFGRNVSPEWVERELVLQSEIKQAAVFGEGRPWNVALIVPESHCKIIDINNAIDKANQNLPDYAQIKSWLTATEPFQLTNNQLTGTGRLRRDAIFQQYAEHIADLYSSNHEIHRKLA